MIPDCCSEHSSIMTMSQIYHMWDRGGGFTEFVLQSASHSHFLMNIVLSIIDDEGGNQYHLQIFELMKKDSNLAFIIIHNSSLLTLVRLGFLWDLNCIFFAFLRSSSVVETNFHFTAIIDWVDVTKNPFLENMLICLKS